MVDSFLLSIITVVYNNNVTISRCLNSVLKGKPDWMEYILIDGESTDGTIDIIRKHELFDKINIFVSERDNGIYSAMNKGVRMSRGHYILFLNSDDELVANLNQNFEQRLRFYLAEAKELLFGGIIYSYGSGSTIDKSHDFYEFDKRFSKNIFLHPGSISSRNLCLRVPFNEELRISSDYLFFLEALSFKVDFALLENFILIRMYEGGISSSPKLTIRFLAVLEIFFVQRRYSLVHASVVLLKSMFKIFCRL